MPHVTEAFQEMEKLVAELSPISVQTFLYIGWRNDTHSWWYKWLVTNIKPVDVQVLEIDENNVKRLLQIKEIFPLLTEVHRHDVRKIKEMGRRWDVVFWDHGPEHIHLGELLETTEQLKSVTNNILFYACPWGSWPQGEKPDDPETHKFDATPEMFSDMGMSVRTVGTSGQMNCGEILSYWRPVPVAG